MNNQCIVVSLNLKRTIKIMKLTVLMLTVCLSQMVAATYAQTAKLSVSAKEETLENVLKQIEKQSEYLFFYNLEEINKNTKISINKEDANIAKTVEKAKKAFAGYEIKGKKLGVIGLGAIGAEVANTAAALGMEVYGYDPYISINAAWALSRDVKHITSVDTIYQECDYITVHVPLLDSTRGMINGQTIGQMKDGVVVLNFARDLLVDDDAMAAALETGKVRRYVTDFPNPKSVAMKNVIAIPHLGASTEESEDNCAKMAVEELMDYLENGNIRNSVNYPNCDMGYPGDNKRITLLHHNIPNMIGQFTALLAKDNVNIDDMTNKSRGSYAYTMIDVDNDVTEDVVKGLEMIESVLKVRVIA